MEVGTRHETTKKEAKKLFGSRISSYSLGLFFVSLWRLCIYILLISIFIFTIALLFMEKVM